VKYISLNDLADQHQFEIDGNFESVYKAISSNELLDHADYKLFLSIQNEQTKVFNGWIEQHKSLKELLISKTTSEFFKDIYKWKQHALFNQFKLYVSPFFEDLLIRKNESQINCEWAIIFSFFELMDDVKRIHLEHNLYQNINSIITEKLSQTSKNIDELKLHQILLFLLSDDSITIHKSLSRASHYLKVSFIEQILQLFFHPKCTAKLAHWMILRLEKLEMNSEQNQSLQQVKSKIRNGEIQFLNNPPNNRPARGRKFLLACSAFAFGFLLIYFYTQEFVVEAQNFKEASSLTFFSIKERKEIDSILKSMTLTMPDTANTDVFSSGTSISIENPIKNELAKHIFNELEQDMNNHFIRAYDTCIPLLKNNLALEEISETRGLDKIPSNSVVEFKNDSEYTFIIIVWMESEKEKVFSGVISKKSSLEMTVSKDMHLILLPGNDYGAIPKEYKNYFKYLTNHFCSIDFNYEYALRQIYSIGNINSKKAKILMEGILGEVIIISDIDGILSH